MKIADSIGKAMGYDIAVSPRMESAIILWDDLYRNIAPWVKEDVKSTGIPSSVCTEIARLVTMECDIAIDGSRKAEIISEDLSGFFTDLHLHTEYACATGGAVFRPCMRPGGHVAVDVLRAGQFYPVSFDREKLTAVIFPEFKRIGKKQYVRLEYQGMDNGTYVIENKAFLVEKLSSNTEAITLGSQVPLSEVQEWSELQERNEIRGLMHPLFSYFRIPLANIVDPDSPLGVSVFSRAIGSIQDADARYAQINWEYASKEAAIQAADEFFQRRRDGSLVLPNNNRRLYRALGSGVTTKDGSPFFNVYSPEIRDQSMYNGYNRLLRDIEYKCGLAYGTLSDPNNVDKTAEEIKASKQRSYDTVKAIQNSLDEALKGMVQAASDCLTLQGVGGSDPEYSADWDDSLVVDKKNELDQLRLDVSLGAVGLVEYRMRRFGETEEQAKEALRKAQEYDLGDAVIPDDEP